MGVGGEVPREIILQSRSVYKGDTFGVLNLLIRWVPIGWIICWSAQMSDRPMFFSSPKPPERRENCEENARRNSMATWRPFQLCFLAKTSTQASETPVGTTRQDDDHQRKEKFLRIYDQTPATKISAHML